MELLGKELGDLVNLLTATTKRLNVIGFNK